MRGLLLIALVLSGCATYVGAKNSQAAGAPGAEDPDIAVPVAPKKEVPQVIDPNAPHLVIGEDEGPTEQVQSQPERPPSPSMLPGVVTGPGGVAPMTVPDE
jgi:hypothetical protein